MAGFVRAGEASPAGARHRDEGVGQDHGAVERASPRQERRPVVVDREEPAGVAGIAERGRRFPERGALVAQDDGLRRGPGDGPEPRPPVAGLQGQTLLVNQVSPELPPACGERRADRAAEPVTAGQEPDAADAAHPDMCRQHVGAGGQRGPELEQRPARRREAVGGQAGVEHERIARGRDRVDGERRCWRGGHDGGDPGGEEPGDLRLRGLEVHGLDVQRLEGNRDGPRPVRRLDRLGRRSAAALRRGRWGGAGLVCRRRGCRLGCSLGCSPGGRVVLVARIARRRRGRVRRAALAGRPPGSRRRVELGYREIDALLDLGAEPCRWTCQREQGPKAEGWPGRPCRRGLRLAGRTRDERRDGRDRETPASHAQPNLTVASGGVEAARSGSAAPGVV